MSDSPIIKNHAAFIWSVADLLRGDYKQSEYGKVVLPLTVLRRLDCVLEPTKDKVLEKAKSLKGKIENQEPVLCAVAKEQFFNTSKLDMKKLLDDPTNLAANLRSYISAFSSGARDVLEKFDFDTQIARMDKANILYMVISKFAEIDLHPTVVSNLEMGYLYEELIRKFSELSNETAGEHFTPREVIDLMVNLLFIEDGKVLTKEGTVRTLFDPACGTGGMLSVGEDHLRKLNPKARLEVFGQELNPETYAICRSDMMLKGQDASHITNGNSFSEDGHKGKTFDYCLANPPFGVEWKKVEKEVKEEHERQGFGGRFGAGLPRINDGSFLFLQHMIAKMKPASEGGSRIAIVFNGSPLFTGAAGSGESEIRRWIIENDWLEAVVALPDSLFYNTGISTYFWIVSNRKSQERQGKVQLIDARSFFTKMRKSLGEKRKEISDEQIEEITRIYGDFVESEYVKIFENAAFGYQRITVERPLRASWQSNGFLTRMDPTSWMREKEIEIDTALQTLKAATYKSAKEAETAFKKVLPSYTAKQIKEIVAVMCISDDHSPIVSDVNGNPEPDGSLRDYENVPLPIGSTNWEHNNTARRETKPYRDLIEAYLKTEVLPYVPDAWVDHEKTKIGFEIPFSRHFYVPGLQKDAAHLDEQLAKLELRLAGLTKQRWSTVNISLEGVEVARAKWLFRERIVRGAHAPLGSVISDQGVVLREESDLTVWNPSDDISSYKLVLPGDFVIGLRSFQHGIVASDVRALVSPAYTVLELLKPDLFFFMRHYLQTDDVITRLNVVASGIRQGKTISFSDFSRLLLPIPGDDLLASVCGLLSERHIWMTEIAEVEAGIRHVLRQQAALLMQNPKAGVA